MMLFAMQDIAADYWETLGLMARAVSIIVVSAGTFWVAFHKWSTEQRRLKLRHAVGIKDRESESPIEDLVATALAEARGNIDSVTTETLEAVKVMKDENQMQHQTVATKIDTLSTSVTDLNTALSTHIAAEAHIDGDLSRLERGLERIEDHLLQHRNGSN